MSVKLIIHHNIKMKQHAMCSTYCTLCSTHLPNMFRIQEGNTLLLLLLLSPLLLLVLAAACWSAPEADVSAVDCELLPSRVAACAAAAAAAAEDGTVLETLTGCSAWGPRPLMTAAQRPCNNCAKRESRSMVPFDVKAKLQCLSWLRKIRSLLGG
jgi:hypothetical protein